MNYRRLFRYLVMIMVGGLGVFNSYKLEIRYETNSNLELLYQNGIIISTLVIIYFTLAFFIEILVSKRKKRVYRIPSKKEYELMKITSVKQKNDTLSAQEFYDKNTKEEE
ncbi:MAG: hypothetical protein ACXACY_18270 [Candidatus Hodarchaeales archaeon]|jgi:hypothetical protein